MCTYVYYASAVTFAATVNGVVLITAIKPTLYRPLLMKRVNIIKRQRHLMRNNPVLLGRNVGKARVRKWKLDPGLLHCWDRHECFGIVLVVARNFARNCGLQMSRGINQK